MAIFSKLGQNIQLNPPRRGDLCAKIATTTTEEIMYRNSSTDTTLRNILFLSPNKLQMICIIQS
jgi:hypothetical protein